MTLGISDDGKDHSIVDRHVDNSASVIKLQIEKEEKVTDARLNLFMLILIIGYFLQANRFLLCFYHFENIMTNSLDDYKTRYRFQCKDFVWATPQK